MYIPEPVFTTDEARILSAARKILLDAAKRLDNTYDDNGHCYRQLGYTAGAANAAEQAIFLALNYAHSYLDCPIATEWLHTVQLCPIARPPLKDQSHAA